MSTLIANTLQGINTIKYDGSVTAATINSDGVMVRGKIPMLKVGISTATTINTGDRILWNTFGSSHVFDGEDNMNAFNTSNNNYTIPANCGGLWYISCSLYTTTSNINQLAASLESLIINNDFRKKLGKNAKKRVSLLYKHTYLSRLLLNYIKKTLNKK